MSKMDNFSKEELTQLVSECTSMRQLAKKCGYVSIGNNDKTIKAKLAEYGISIEHFTGLSKEKVKRNTDNIFCENSSAGQTTLRRWYLKGNYSEYKCAICGQPPIWNNKSLTLTLDHINGNNHDDRLENLRWICPNCDRQLPTFGFKNKHSNQNIDLIYDESGKISSNSSTKALNKTLGLSNNDKTLIKQPICKQCGKIITNSSKTGLCFDCYIHSTRKVERPDREELKKLIRTQTFTFIGNTYGVNDNSIRKWCKAENLPTRKKDILLYTDEEWASL